MQPPLRYTDGSTAPAAAASTERRTRWGPDYVKKNLNLSDLRPAQRRLVWALVHAMRSENELESRARHEAQLARLARGQRS